MGLSSMYHLTKVNQLKNQFQRWLKKHYLVV